MNILDIIIVVMAALGAFFGWKKGFSVTASYFAGSFLGSWAGSNYYSLPAKLTGGYVKSSVAGYLLVFFAVFAAVVVAGIILNKLFKIVFLGWADSLAGLSVGIVLSLSIAGALLVPCQIVKIKPVRRLVNRSFAAKIVVSGTKRAIKVFPPKKNKFFDLDLQKNIEPVLKKLERV